MDPAEPFTPLAFLRSREARQVLERAARSAGTPLSLHYVEHGEEGPVINSWGRCAACAYVNDNPEGLRRCRASRLTVAEHALRQKRPQPFLCHMRFACVTVPALPGESFTLTFGPYCPAEAAHTLESDAREALAGIEAEPPAEFPAPLDDIHRAPAGAVHAVAEWTMERLAELWSAASSPAPASSEPEVAPLGDKQRRRLAPSEVNAYPSAEIAAALAGGNQPEARRLMQGALAESGGRPRVQIAVRRARTVAVVAAALEAAEGAGLNTAEAWARFGAFVQSVQGARTDAALLDAATVVLGTVRRRANLRSAPKTSYAALNDVLNDRLVEGVTLEEAAKQMGETPSAISHRLRRQFGMSFSEYVGRLRMNKAKDLLRRTRLSVTEVARRVGVRDQSNFGKLFRKYEGLSPSDYRKRYGRPS